MQEDFHYYGTYAAAFLAGYSHEECMEISYSDQFTDQCSETLIQKLKGPENAATTQLSTEMAGTVMNRSGIQKTTRIWSSFHFLPGDLYAELPKRNKAYMNKFRLICRPNGKLVEKTVNLALNKHLSAVGIAMHVLADTWAHQYFAGTPSLVINNTNGHFYEVTDKGQRRIRFGLTSGENIEEARFVNSIYQTKEYSIMNLGHGRAGHLPDYSYMRYKYLPAWADYEEIYKNNPEDYYHAFAQMVYAMKYIRGDIKKFETDTYAFDELKPYEARIRAILSKRQKNASEDWKTFGEELSGCTIDDYDFLKYQAEYENASENDRKNTFLGHFFDSAMAQKGMVIEEILKSGNSLAGNLSKKMRESKA